MKYPIGGAGMRYFSAKEASRIVRYSSRRLLMNHEEDPNYAAFQECVKIAYGLNPEGGYWHASLGFLLGYATGIRAERARRREKKGDC